MKMVHHGADDGVTGSCHQLWVDEIRSVLVDCGTFQGDDARRHPNPEIDFPLRGIAGLILTHAHIDHVGRVPYLMAAGFDGPVYCSRPTAELLPLVMEDALRIGFTRRSPLIEAFLQHIGERLRPVGYGEWTPIEGTDARLRLRPAGHILGSAVVEVEVADGRRVVFSGDLGAPHTPLLKDFTSPERADVLVLESTYGDRRHEGRGERQQHLECVLRRTLENRGVTIIPAFSLGRTQELLYEMNAIFERVQEEEQRTLMRRVDVIVDSPLAARFTAVYDQLRPYWDEEAHLVLQTGDQPLVFENLVTVGDHQEHVETLKYVADHRLPAIVIAGSGMCTGGRVVNYLRRLLPEPETDVVFCGYQASGTPGRHIQQGSRQVALEGQRVDVRAAVHQLSGYSAHADQADLIRFVEGFDQRPAEIRLVHGEAGPKQALRRELETRGYVVAKN